MAINIRLYAFGKKPNSTMKPDPQYTENESFSCLFKEPFNLLNPVIMLQHDNPTIYNYAYIGKFGRYYFINNWEYDTGIWYGYLNVDVLSSRKAEIGESTQYVMRSESSYDDTIIDTLYPCFAGEARNRTKIANPWEIYFSKGYFVLGVINSDVSSTGGFVSYYVFTASGLNKLKQYMLGRTDWFTANITEISENLQKELFNPSQYIASCLWFPKKPPVTNIPVSTIKFGWWDLENQTAEYLDSSAYIKNDFVFDVPQHPQKETRGIFLQRSSDYTEFTLFFPPFGEIHIPAENLTGSSQLYCRVVIDFITGIAHMTLSPFEEYTTIIVQTQAMLAVPIQTAQINNSPISAGANIIGGLFNVGVSAIGMGTGNIITKLGFAQNLGNSFLDAAVGTAKSLAPNVSTSGANGTLSCLQFAPELKAKFKLLVDEDVNHFGRPYCKKVKIQTLAGFVKCSGADMTTNATQEENNMLNAYLNEGFYYE